MVVLTLSNPLTGRHDLAIITATDVAIIDSDKRMMQDQSIVVVHLHVEVAA